MTWGLTSLVSVDTIQRVEEYVLAEIEEYPTILAAVAGAPSGRLYRELEPNMEWRNFLWVYGEVLRSHFGGDAKQTSVQTEE